MPEILQQALAAADDDTISRLSVCFADFRSRRGAYAGWQAALRRSQVPATTPDPAPFDVRDQLGGLTVPTVVVAGEDDCRPAVRRASGFPGVPLVRRVWRPVRVRAGRWVAVGSQTDGRSLEARGATIGRRRGP
ncbi:hypothetical protein [Actinoplanes sp. N902-109]|uniref:hypothetical protein n=1 Tax=Actinoplanes sp. (strain N902-109) TaxID=649831 RepID=UPI000329353C|nr:hypothetical protein [Actinoplanes sp. N902-109]AGL17288.1 hypothetical protein L083_3778 [Actinoplanes sp. N902-109]